jgi:protein-L-isoaspartate(D-aspartate) O-methyltransferase
MTNRDQEYAAAREVLVRTLAAEITDQRVLEAISRVPRERFIAIEARDLAYVNRPLPIGHGQTISQPTMIAVMLQELRLTGVEKVLDVGTGSGYQAALLSLLASEVMSVELVPALASRAREVLAELGYANIEVKVAGDTLGWPEAAPYDAIIVGAAAPRVPRSLVDQLGPAGRLVIPVGDREQQDLMLIEKTEEGLVVTRKGGCRFVPLIGREAYAGSPRLPAPA